MNDNTIKQQSHTGANGTNGTNTSNGSAIQPPESDVTLVADATIPSFDLRGEASNPWSTARSIVTMTDETVKRVKLLAQMLETSSFNNSRNPMKQGDYFLIMLKGLAVGLDPIIAVDFISVIQGKPVIDGKGLLALILNAKKRGEVEDIIIDSQEEYCTVTIKRKGMTAHSETFTLADARRMKTTSWENGQKQTIPLIEKDNWKQQPRTMLKWRAVAACARAHCADIIGGLYSKEEITDGDIEVLEDGTMNLLAPQPKQSAPTNITRLPANNRPKPSTNGNTPSTDAPPPPPTEYDPITGKEVNNAPTPTELAPDDVRNHIKTYGADHWFIKNADAFFKMLRYVTPNHDSMTNDELSAYALKTVNAQNWKGFKTGWVAFTFYCQKLGITAPTYDEIIGTKPQSTTPAPVPTPKTESKPQATTPPTAPKPTQTAPAPAPAPTPAPTNWHDDFVDWLYTYFDIKNIAEWEAKSGKRITDYKSLTDAQDATTAIAQENCWDILATTAKYYSIGRDTYIEFHSLYTVRMYGRSSKFKSQVGDEYYAEYGVGDWKPNGEYEIGLLKVAWRRNEKGTPIAHTVTVLGDGNEDDYPSDLTPEEEDALAKVEM